MAFFAVSHFTLSPCHPITLSPKAEGEGLEPPSDSRRRLFSRQVPHPAGCLPLLCAVYCSFSVSPSSIPSSAGALARKRLRGLESNQRPPGSGPGVTTNSNYPGSLRHTISRKARGEGIEPSSPGSKPGGLPLTDPRIAKSALWESNPPRQVGSLEPLPLGQGHICDRVTR